MRDQQRSDPGPQDGVAGARASTGSGSAPAELAATRATEAGQMNAAEALLSEVVTAALYHRARMAWFAGLHRLGMFINILAGTGAVAAVVTKDAQLTLEVSLLVAFVSAANLAFDFAGFARKHEDSRRLYHDIAAELEEDGAEEARVRRLRARMIRASASEPTVYEAAQAVAFNAAIRSLGRDEQDEFVLSRPQRLLRHLWPYGGRKFPRRKDFVRAVH